MSRMLWGACIASVTAQLFLASSQMLTSNLDKACPGQELIYTYVSAGNSHRWNINIVAESIIRQLIVRSSTTSSIIEKVNSHLFNLTLVSTNYYNFTSILTTIATENLHNTMIVCTSASSQFSAQITIITGKHYNYCMLNLTVTHYNNIIIIMARYSSFASKSHHNC